MFSLEDVRYNNFYLMNTSLKWTTSWDQFPGIPIVLPFERFIMSYKHKPHIMMANYWHYSVYISAVYVLIIFGLKNWMIDRKPFGLRKPLAVWSSLLALFSVVGTIRCLPEFIHILSHKGFIASFTQSTYYLDIRLNVWYLIFVLSKAVELGDTIFIVLRKQKLHQLHWIHHVLTLCFSWFVFPDVPATARWMVNMNFLIHSFMYCYYALKALRFQIPKPFAVTITTGQIIQMMFGFWINLYSFQLKITGKPCDCSLAVASTGLLLYSLFFILFINFFFKTYILPIFIPQKSIILNSTVNLNSSELNNNKQKTQKIQ